MQHAEGHPRFKLIPFKRRVDRVTPREPQGGNRPVRLLSQTPLAVTNIEDALRQTRSELQAHQQACENNSLLSEEAKASLRAFDENADRSWREYQEMRDREPKITFSYDDWRKYWEPTKQAIEEITETVKTAELKEIAEDIKKTMWGEVNTRPVRPSGGMYINVKDDGTVINRSTIGFALSYSPEGKKIPPHHLGFHEIHELVITVGYYGADRAEDRSDIIPEAQGLVSDEDWKRGVLAYAIRTHYGKKLKGSLEIIPFAYAEAKQTFLEHLYDAAVDLDPRNFVPHLRRQATPQPQQLAA